MDGFVYLWRDRKYSRYYVGCHWGSDEDNYVCSSKWMLRAYTRRKEDFTRKIISRVNGTHQDVLDEEYRWLQMIKPEELGKGSIKKYYNLHNHHYGHWTSDEENSLSIREKISVSSKKCQNSGRFLNGHGASEAVREKISKGNKGKQSRLGLSHTTESKQKISESTKGKSHPHKGVPRSEDAIRKMVEWRTGTCVVNNGSQNRKIKKEDLDKWFEEGYQLGMIKKNK